MELFLGPVEYVTNPRMWRKLQILVLRLVFDFRQQIGLRIYGRIVRQHIVNFHNRYYEYSLDFYTRNSLL